MKNGTTIMIDAGYNYERLKEKMSWLDIDPASIRHIFITHQDTRMYPGPRAHLGSYGLPD